MIAYMIEQELGNLLPFEVPFATLLLYAASFTVGRQPIAAASATAAETVLAT